MKQKDYDRAVEGIGLGIRIWREIKGVYLYFFGRRKDPEADGTGGPKETAVETEKK